MVASQQSLSGPASNPRPLTAANPIHNLTSTRSDIQSAIADNLPPNYYQETDPDHGYRWFCVSQKTAFTTEIYLNAAKRRINISAFDNRGQNIKAWSSNIRMTGNWRRRLRRAAGEAVILVNQRPDCPRCKSPLVVKDCPTDQSQFFGCSTPTCVETIIITNHDLETVITAEWTTPQQEEEVYSSIAFNLPPNYYQVNDPEHGSRWFCQSKRTGFKARIEPTLQHARISITIVDRKGATINDWSGDIQMVADWPSRLRRASGEALVLVHQLPKCPVCRSAMELRKRHHDQKQFFGCSKYPTCFGTMIITDHDVERIKAAG
jgi:ssDNA-binding Zn-finger/Zn-ribbon topoisomerase 1